MAKDKGHVYAGGTFPNGEVAPPVLDRLGNELAKGSRVHFIESGCIEAGEVADVYWFAPVGGYRIEGKVKILRLGQTHTTYHYHPQVLRQSGENYHKTVPAVKVAIR